jgi:hypothetical protein
MLYESRGKDAMGRILTIKVADDAPGDSDFLTVYTEDGQDLCSIEFDIFVENRFRIALAQSFTQYSYRSPFEYLSSMGFPLGESKHDTFFDFSVEDAIFAKQLEEYGLETPIATRIAFYTQDFTKSGLGDKRDEDLIHFMANNFGVRVENREYLRGFTTIDIYMLASQRSNRNIADYLTREARGVPSLIGNALNSLGTLISRGVAIDKLSLSQLGALTTVVDSNFPLKYVGDDKADIITRTIANFVSQEHNLKEAPKVLRRRSLVKLNLSDELMRLIDYHDPHSYGNQKTGNDQTMALGSIFIATYGEEFMMRALTGFKRQEHILNLNSPHALSAFVAYVIHLSNGGDEDTPIHFVLALEPDIDDSSIIDRGDWKFDEEED